VDFPLRHSAPPRHSGESRNPETAYQQTAAVQSRPRYSRPTLVIPAQAGTHLSGAHGKNDCVYVPENCMNQIMRGYFFEWHEFNEDARREAQMGSRLRGNDGGEGGGIK